MPNYDHIDKLRDSILDLLETTECSAQSVVVSMISMATTLAYDMASDDKSAQETIQYAISAGVEDHNRQPHFKKRA